jgi:GGDEF domain-containing protein
MFGHLAGNDCMRKVGAATLAWAGREVADWPFAICATFGGDEVIVGGAGVSYQRFGEAIARLRDRLGEFAPRTCSFATGTTGPRPFVRDAVVSYRCLVASVDYALFARTPCAPAAGGRRASWLTQASST